MGAHKNIAHDRFPAQTSLKGERIRVCFHYDTDHVIYGTCIRDDAEAPHETIIALDDGRVVLTSECQYQLPEPTAPDDRLWSIPAGLRLQCAMSLHFARHIAARMARRMLAQGGRSRP